MSQEWYYAKGDQKQGPITPEQLKALAKSGALKPTNLVWTEGMKDWTQAGSVKGLFPGTQSLPPTPGPTTTTKTPVPVGTKFDDIRKTLGVLTETTKAAGHLAAAEVRKAQLTKITLPAAYMALGRDIFTIGRFRSEFPGLYAQIGELQAQITRLTTGRESKPGGSFAQKAKQTASKIKDTAKAKTLSLKIDSLMRRLGEVGFTDHGEKSGPLHLVQPIMVYESNKEAISKEIDSLSGVGTGKLLTPRRLLLSGFGLVALFLALLVTARREDGQLLSGTMPVKQTTDSASPNSVGTSIGVVTIKHEPYTQVFMPTLPSSRIHPPQETRNAPDSDDGAISLHNDDDYISQLSLTSAKGLVATTHPAGVVKIWSLKERKVVTTLKSNENGGATARVCFSPSGMHLLTASTEYRLWEVEGGWKKIPLARQDNGCLYAAAFSPDSQVIAGVEGHYARSLQEMAQPPERSEAGVNLWNAETGNNLLGISDTSTSELDKTSLKGEPRSVAISNTFLACGSATGRVQLWNWREKRLLTTIEAHDGRVIHLAFSSKGDSLATAGIGGDCKLWKVPTGELQRDLQGNGKAIFVTFLPGDDFIGTVNTVNQQRESEMIHIWSVSSGKRTLSRTILDDMMTDENSVASDGNQIAAAGVHLLQVRRLVDQSKGEEIRPVVVPDLSAVDFTKGPNGEPIDLEEAPPGKNTPYRSYYYQNIKGRRIPHGPSTTFSPISGKKLDEAIYVNGVMKVMQTWEPWKHRPTRLEIYKGDNDHTREYYEYFDSGKGDIKQIERWKIRHTLTETGERTEDIRHGISMLFYDNTLVMNVGRYDKIAGVARIENYDDGKLVGLQVFDREGRLTASQGTIGAFLTPTQW